MVGTQLLIALLAGRLYAVVGLVKGILVGKKVEGCVVAEFVVGGRRHGKHYLLGAAYCNRVAGGTYCSVGRVDVEHLGKSQAILPVGIVALTGRGRPSCKSDAPVGCRHAVVGVGTVDTYTACHRLVRRDAHSHHIIGIAHEILTLHIGAVCGIFHCLHGVVDIQRALIAAVALRSLKVGYAYVAHRLI